MAPTGRSSDVIHTQEEAALFDSLCLLDVRAADGGRLIDWHRAMFRKPNARALECVLHHVYCVTNGRAAAKKARLRYSDCRPLPTQCHHLGMLAAAFA